MLVNFKWTPAAITITAGAAVDAMQIIITVLVHFVWAFVAIAVV